MKHAGSYSDEDCYNDDTDGFDRRKIKVDCPNCKRVFAALCSPRTDLVASGWRWVGCDHKEPYARWSTLCRCGTQFTFDTYTPQ